MKPFVAVLLGSFAVTGCGPAQPATAESGGMTLKTGQPVGLLPTAAGSWNCPFPTEADAQKIDEGLALIEFVVSADGIPLSASILSDSGHGFGRAALVCVMNRRYQPALNEYGAPMSAYAKVSVRFAR